MCAAASAVTAERTGVGPGATHHAGAVILCRPVWRVPWLAPIRAIVLLLLAITARVVTDVNLWGSTVHRAASVAQWPAFVLAIYVSVHPVLLRAQFRRARAGSAVTVAWAGRDGSGQPWLVLRSLDGRAWRARPRQGPVEYPVPRWRGTPWLCPPPFATAPVRGTLLRPRWTWRRGLVLHAHSGDSGAPQKHEDGWAMFAFGHDLDNCVGIHLRAVRRLSLRGAKPIRGAPHRHAFSHLLDRARKHNESVG